jgi:GNAT superfamily N-acetyltransferase
MKGQGGGGTARGGGVNRSGGGSIAVTKTKARQTAAIDDSILLLREALFNEKGKDKDVAAGIAKSFLVYEIAGKKIDICFAASLTEEEVDWAFELTKATMEERQDSSGYGWDDDDKMRELTEQGARFLLIRDSITRELRGYLHFRFTVQGEVLDQMSGSPCAYVIDVHLEDALQRHGLGKHLLVLLELIARRERMTRVSVPVFIGDDITKAWLVKIGRGYGVDASFADLGFEPALEV